MNDVLNAQGYTQAAWWNRIPIAAWGPQVLLIALFANMGIGYDSRGANPGPIQFLVLPLILAIAFFFLSLTSIARAAGSFASFHKKLVKSLSVPRRPLVSDRRKFSAQLNNCTGGFAIGPGGMQAVATEIRAKSRSARSPTCLSALRILPLRYPRRWPPPSLRFRRWLRMPHQVRHRRAKTLRGSLAAAAPPSLRNRS